MRYDVKRDEGMGWEMEEWEVRWMRYDVKGDEGKGWEMEEWEAR